MGQRHQLFIIARICHRGSTEAAYRCITAIHHQWLYGQTALAACKAFLTLVRNKDNTALVTAELAAIASEYALDEELPPYPAPFLSWMLFVALALRMEDQYTSSSASMLDPNMGSHDGDNNDGITVFDVTDPSSPAYCFVSIFGLEATHGSKVPRNIPLTAEAYVRAYYPSPSEYEYEDDEENIDEQESDVQQCMESFKGEKLIERWMLAETWPGYGYETHRDEDTAGMENETTTSGDAAATTSLSVPSLSELSLRQAIVQAEESRDNTGLEVALSLPSVGASILNMLAELDHYSTEIFTILLKALSADSNHEPGVLDLSRYAFTAEQIIDVAAQFPATKILNLNGNISVNGPALIRLLPSLPELSRLLIYGCPNVSLSDIDAIRSLMPNLEAIFHRPLMIRFEAAVHDWGAKSVDESCTYPPSFTFAFKIKSMFDREESIIGCSLPSLSPRAIVIALCDFHDFLLWTDSYALRGSLNPKVFFSSLSREPHVTFKERAVGNIPEDATLATQGWVYAMTSLPGAGVYADPTSYKWGFVKYKFSNSGGAGGEPSSLQDVDVLDLANWLKEVDSKQEVEREWVERLEQRLLPSDKVSMIAKEQVVEMLTEDITSVGDAS